MLQVIDQNHTSSPTVSSPTVFSWREKDDLTNLGYVYRLPVVFIDDVAYVGFSYTVASWTIERAAGKLWVTRFADGVGCPCDGWRVAVASVEDAMARVRADSETEGWNR